MKWWIGVLICIAPLAILSNYFEELDIVGGLLCTVIAVFAFFKGIFFAAKKDLEKDLAGLSSKRDSSTKPPLRESTKDSAEITNSHVDSHVDSLLKANVVWYPEAMSFYNEIGTTTNGVPGKLFFKKDKIVFQRSDDLEKTIDFGYPFSETAVLRNGIRLWDKWTYFFTFESLEELDRAKHLILMVREESLKEALKNAPLDENGRRIVTGNWSSGASYSKGRSQWSTVERGARFERECQRDFDYRGYSTKVTGKTGDFGVDIVATRNGERVAVQCKNWESKVGPRAIQEVVAGRIHYGCNKAVVVSQNGFTKAAQELARSNGVILCTKEELSRML